MSVINTGTIATVQASSEQVSVLMLSRKDLIMLAKSKSLDQQYMEAFKNMSSKRADEKKLMKKTNWRDHVRLRNLYDEIVSVDSDDTELVREEGVKLSHKT